ncbi:MAG: inositol 2-dehydrogenase [Acidimicrobiales bacterium]|nr:inositol 2-dehydrogenase [Acidimicrobiales bacterium]
MHAELIATRVAGATVAGVFDVVPDAATATAQRLNVAAFGSVADVMASDADAVAICTSTPTHVDLIVAAAEAGKAIFCEKPVSLDLEEVDRGLAAVTAAGVPLHIGFNRRFDPSHAAVRAAVAAGEVGELRQLRISSRDPEPPPIDYVKVSGGIFLDMTIHDFDMARFVTGSEVVEVYATGSVMVDPAIGAEGDLDTVTVMLTHQNGVTTTIDNCRQSAFGYDQRVEAFGSLGIVASENHTATSTIRRSAAGSTGAVVPHFFLERYIPSYVYQWEQFVAAVRDGTQTPVTGADGRAPLVIGLAAKLSAVSNQPVRIS